MGRPSHFVQGKTYGRLTGVVKLDGGRAIYLCACKALHDSHVGHVTSRKTTSCGCLHREVASKGMRARTLRHGMFGTRIYAIWTGMKQRCLNPRHRSYFRYGGRGIQVDQRWLVFDAFYADMGDPPPGFTLERKNNDEEYSHNNCVWATRKVQANNTRGCLVLTHEGISLNVTQWAERLNTERQLIYDRIKAGWPASQALTQPKRGKK